MKLCKIISGGQTGADTAGLLAARELGIHTGGYAPRGFWTEVGAAPWLSEYGLREFGSGYKERTIANVRLADATVIFGKKSPGSLMTEYSCRSFTKPYVWVPTKQHLPIFEQWLITIDPRVLNVAGNRESVNPGIGEWVKEMIVQVVKLMRKPPVMITQS